MSHTQYPNDQFQTQQTDTQGLNMSLMALPNNIPRFSANDWRMFGNGIDSYGSELSRLERCDSLNETHSDVLPVSYNPNYDKESIVLNTYEIPFVDRAPLDYTLHLEGNQKPASTHDANQSAVELDKKLLGFSNPIGKAPLFDDTGQTWPIMAAELYGMFFVAEDVFGEHNTRANELTCYRRNLFQISGTIILSRGIKGMLNEQGQLVPIYNLEATLTAFESIEGKSTEIISVPWKSANNLSSEEKSGTAPPRYSLNLSLNPEMDPNMVSLPLSWKRLQFKHATANNGRRKGLQQHYVVQVNLVATFATGETFKLAEIQSGPIIVRGRSPRNFDNRVKEGEKKFDMKTGSTTEISTSPHVKADPGSACDVSNFASDPFQLPSPDLQDWSNVNTSDPSENHPIKKSKTSHSSDSNTLNYPSYQHIWKPESSTNKSSALSPIELSLMEDDYNLGNSTSKIGHDSFCESRSPDSEKSKKCLNNLLESADFLYEYFPLSLDDWMPPVDAVYRPHIVHHMIVPEDTKTQLVQGKRKKYFSAKD